MNRCASLLVCFSLVIGIILAIPSENRKFVEQDKIINSLSDSNGGEWATCSEDPEYDMTVVELIRNAGYPAEEHFVESEDGYILGLHRIPGPPGSRAVFLHHGFLDSSFAWIMNGKNKALAYELANDGYDVWMGNARGNIYSRRHRRRLPSRDPDFWNFSWHEMGRYDLPAQIDYITSRKNDSLFYVGHSLGTTIFFVMASERPAILPKVKAMFALGPAVYLDHLSGLLFTFMSITESFMKYTNGHLPFMTEAVLRYPATCVCNRSLYKEVCRDLVFLFSGFNPQKFDMSLLPLMGTHLPTGTSLKTAFHSAQVYRAKKFVKYDYGAKGNLKLYDSASPPEYDMSKVEVPVAFFYGQNDIAIPPKDVLRSWKQIPNKIGLFKMEDPNFTHLDFLAATHTSELVNSKILLLLKKYGHKN